MANAVVDWGGPKPAITYGPKGNRSKVPIRFIGSAEADGASSSDSEKEVGGSNTIGKRESEGYSTKPR